MPMIFSYIYKSTTWWIGVGREIYNFILENRVGVDGVDNLFGASVFLRLTFLTTTSPSLFGWI